MSHHTHEVACFLVDTQSGVAVAATVVVRHYCDGITPCLAAVVAVARHDIYLVREVVLFFEASVGDNDEASGRKSYNARYAVVLRHAVGAGENGHPAFECGVSDYCGAACGCCEG